MGVSMRGVKLLFLAFTGLAGLLAGLLVSSLGACLQRAAVSGEPAGCPTCPAYVCVTVTPAAAPTLPAPTLPPSPDPTATPAEPAAGLKWSNTPGLIGVCHQVGMWGINGVNWGFLTGLLTSWAAMEPQPGVFVWHPAGNDPRSTDTLQEAVSVAQAAPGRSIWVQAPFIMPFSTEDYTPAWVYAAGVESLQLYGDLKRRPNVFDPDLIELHRPIVRAMAGWLDPLAEVSAVIPPLGDWSELHFLYTCMQEPCGSDPASSIVRAAAARAGVSPAAMVAAWVDPLTGERWEHRVDYALLEWWFKPMVRLYAEEWERTPIVVQLGNGVSWNHQLAPRAAAWCVKELGPRCWLKQNGHGSSVTATYNSLFRGFAGMTRTGWEGGHLSYWTDAAANAATLEQSLRAGVSFICYQSDILRNSAAYPMPAGLGYAEQARRLRANYEAIRR